jgi:hypothetical protein
MSDTSTAPIILNEGKVRAAIGDPDTPALVLFTIALSEWGPLVMGDPEEGIDQMDPSEMWADLHTRYGTWVPEEGENKLNAMITGLAGGLFWRDVDVFMSVATALFDGDMGDLLDVGFEELSATEIMWAIMEMELAWDSEETPEFSFNVQSYIEDSLAKEQEDQDENAREVEQSYLLMLDQFRGLGIPASMIRAWDEEYSAVMMDLEDGELD